MDNNGSDQQDNLKSFERRLAEWRPDSKGLHPDQMLYAAGLAAGKRGPGKMAWPALCLIFAFVSVMSLSWGLFERAEHQALASRINQQRGSTNDFLAPAFTGLATVTYSPLPNDYFHLRRQVEEHPVEWLASSEQINHQPAESAPLKPNILKAGQYDRWRDQ